MARCRSGSRSSRQPFPLDTINAVRDEDEEDVDTPITGARLFCKCDYTTLYWLVFAGPDAGVVWMSTHHGWTPLRADGTWAETIEGQCETPRENRVEFIDWYVQWLDEKLWDLARDTPDGDTVLDREDLETLVLDGNRSLDLPGACKILASAPKLRRLSLSSMSLDVLPDELALLTQVRSLGLSFNRLSDIEVLAKMPNLYGIDVVCSGPDGMGAKISTRFYAQRAAMLSLELEAP